MLFTQYYLDCLSQASYLVADETSKQAIIVDPRRDVEEYLADLKEHDLTLVGVINTHFHADFVAGHVELAEQTGAWIGFGDAAETEFDSRSLVDGESISLGDVSLTVMTTPGHTPESISLLVSESADAAVPYGVLTGDTLFIGDVGRPDLLASVGVSQEELASMLYKSVQKKLMSLDDAVRVFPGHGAGSACGKNLSTDRQSTIGAQRRENYACQPMSESEFFDLIVTGQPSAPEYFVNSVGMNKSSHAVRPLDNTVPELTPSQVVEASQAGAVIVDTRCPEDFSDQHIVTSLNVGVGGRFAETAGMFVAAGDQVIIVADAGEEQIAATRLSRVGLDGCIGFITDLEAFFEKYPEQASAASRLTAEEFNSSIDPSAMQVVDLRNSGELEAGFVEGSVHLPLAEVKRRADELDRSRPVVTYCAGGWRSSVGSSYLRKLGFTDVQDVIGGFGQISPEAVCPSTLAAQ